MTVLRSMMIAYNVFVKHHRSYRCSAVSSIYSTTRLRADYVHLREMQQDNNVENVGRLVILPSSFIEVHYMHERTQDAFCYVQRLIILYTLHTKRPGTSLTGWDQHWDDALAEASISESPQRLRNLFAVMLVFCALSDAALLWHKYQNKLAERTFQMPGGTGKTFLTKVILAKVRGQVKLRLSFIGHSSHFVARRKTIQCLKFRSTDRTENPVCNISRNSNKAKVLRDCSLIIWDECTMANRKAIEALDRTLRDIKQNGQTMGGITTFCGDFRQTLPVIPRGTRADEVRPV
ncbi:hypothetical protein EVAR_103438_1 [Eumeta japonica]|uniref:ATP-dependent DNA helicase n=1 Tax=Eumeta variegata TaxID=151549 RepID=A0A4C1SZB2_EUMVA|nr:hypothetical protein EVAR_103438_1 [Eumeta japonica]